MARTRNNIFGMVRLSFDDVESCVQYFGRLMNSYDNKHNVTMTATGINKRYCEQSSWSGKVVSIMNKYVDKANNSF